jgi:hypothetical protein
MAMWTNGLKHLVGHVLPGGVERLDDAQQAIAAYLRPKYSRDTLIYLCVLTCPFPPDDPCPKRFWVLLAFPWFEKRLT